MFDGSKSYIPQKLHRVHYVIKYQAQLQSLQAFIFPFSPYLNLAAFLITQSSSDINKRKKEFLVHGLFLIVKTRAMMNNCRRFLYIRNDEDIKKYIFVYQSI